jgi:hypothetical protein
MTFHPRTLVRLYPARWRRRYAEEMLAMIGECRLGHRDALNIAASAIWMRVQTAATAPPVVGVVAAGVGSLLGRGATAVTPASRISDAVLGLMLLTWIALMWRPSGRPDALWRTVALLTVAVLAGAASTWRLPTLAYLSDVSPALAWLGTAGIAFPIATNAVGQSEWHRRRRDEEINLGWPPDAPKGWA